MKSLSQKVVPISLNTLIDIFIFGVKMEPGEDVENSHDDSSVETVLDALQMSRRARFAIYFGIFLIFIGLILLFSSMMFLEFSFYREEGIIPIYVGLIMIPIGLFFCTMSFTAIGLSKKDIDHRIRLGAFIVVGLCLLSAFFFLFSLNFLFALM